MSPAPPTPPSADPDKRYVLAIDQGTTSTRAILFDDAGRPLATAQREFAQHYPQAGWVEHDLEDIWRDTKAVGNLRILTLGIPAKEIVDADGVLLVKRK